MLVEAQYCISGYVLLRVLFKVPKFCSKLCCLPDLRKKLPSTHASFSSPVKPDVHYDLIQKGSLQGLSTIINSISTQLKSVHVV